MYKFEAGSSPHFKRYRHPVMEEKNADLHKKFVIAAAAAIMAAICVKVLFF